LRQNVPWRWATVVSVLNSTRVIHGAAAEIVLVVVAHGRSIR